MNQKSHFDEDLELQQIYRYLDKLHRTQQELVQEISVAHTRKILGGNIGLVFYDVTTHISKRILMMSSATKVGQKMENTANLRSF